MINEYGQLQLQRTGFVKTGPVLVDFVNGSVAHRRRFGGGKRQAIAKAVGLHDAKHSLNVIDATAGFGQDAFVLATLGCNVTLLERSPLVCALLNDGLQRAAKEVDVAGIINRMHLIQQDAHSYLSQIESGKICDVVYLDPMFPCKKKSAASNKIMQYLQTLIDDNDADELLPPALLCARYRVVVKRPRIAPVLNNTPPDYQLIGKRNRFDIYIVQSLKK